MGSTRTKTSDFGPTGVVLPSSKAYAQGLDWMAEPVSRRPQQVARAVVWGVVGSLLLLLALSAFLTVRNVQLNRDLRATLETQYNPSYRVRYADLGAEAVRSYYAGAPAPIALAAGLVWPTETPEPGTALSASVSEPGPDPGAGAAPTDLPGAQPGATRIQEQGDGADTLDVSGIAFVSGDQSPTPGRGTQYQERLTYSALVNGLPYRIGVAVGIPDLDDYASVPVLLSTPTLSPVLLGEQTDQVTSEPLGYASADLPDATLEQLTSWARAYAGDERSGLRQFARDEREDFTYLGLAGGWEYVPNSTVVQWSHAFPDDDRAAIAEVTFDIKVPDTVVPATSDSAERTVTGPVQTQRMDVLIEDYSSGVPVISSYGPAGSYPDLIPRSVAVPAASAPPAPAVTGVEQP